MATGGSDGNERRRWRKREQDVSDESEIKRKSPKASGPTNDDGPPLIDLTTTPTSDDRHTTPTEHFPPPPRRNIIRLGRMTIDVDRAVQLPETISFPTPSIHVIQGRQFADEDEELEFLLQLARSNQNSRRSTQSNPSSSTSGSSTNTTTTATGSITSSASSTTGSTTATGGTTHSRTSTDRDGVVVIDSDSDDEDDVIVTNETRGRGFPTAHHDIAQRFRALFERDPESERSGVPWRDPFRTETGEEIYIRRTIHPTVVFSTIIGPGGFPLIGPSMGSYEDLLELAERLGPGRSQGLTEEAISSLPVKSHCKDEVDPLKLSCVICMMDYHEGESKKVLPCNHDFHISCINPWLKDHKTCPVCRDEIST